MNSANHVKLANLNNKTQAILFDIKSIGLCVDDLNGVGSKKVEGPCDEKINSLNEILEKISDGVNEDLKTLETRSAKFNDASAIKGRLEALKLELGLLALDVLKFQHMFKKS